MPETNPPVFRVSRALFASAAVPDNRSSSGRRLSGALCGVDRDLRRESYTGETRAARLRADMATVGPNPQAPRHSERQLRADSQSTIRGAAVSRVISLPVLRRAGYL